MREKDIYAIATNDEELRSALTPRYTWYEKLFSHFAKRDYKKTIDDFYEEMAKHS